MNKTGGQAFPNEGFNGWGEPEKGMTLRDYFAAKAIQAMISSPHCDKEFNATHKVKTAYAIADEMLKAREA